MNRIKYRLWDRREHKMIYPEEMQHSKNLLAIGLHGLPIAVDRDSFKEDEIVGWNVDHYLIPMQFTGLPDKEKRDIYEGDIVFQPCPNKEYEQESHCIVRFGKVNIGSNGWEYDCWINGFYCERINEANEEFKPDEIMTNRMIEGNVQVIGNIYENSDLLEATHDA